MPLAVIVCVVNDKVVLMPVANGPGTPVASVAFGAIAVPLTTDAVAVGMVSVPLPARLVALGCVVLKPDAVMMG